MARLSLLPCLAVRVQAEVSMTGTARERPAPLSQRRFPLVAFDAGRTCAPTLRTRFEARDDIKAELPARVKQLQLLIPISGQMSWVDTAPRLRLMHQLSFTQTEITMNHSRRQSYPSARRRDPYLQQVVSLTLVEHQRGLGGRLLIHEIDVEAVRQQIQGFRWARDGP